MKYSNIHTVMTRNELGMPFQQTLYPEPVVSFSTVMHDQCSINMIKLNSSCHKSSHDRSG